MKELSGWVFDLYEDERDGLVIWFLSEKGERLRLHMAFPRTFYAAGEKQRLQRLHQVIKSLLPSNRAARLYVTKRKSVFDENLLRVLAIEIDNPVTQSRLFHQVLHAFPDLEYYDTDIPAPLLFTAQYGVFPLGMCQVTIDDTLSIVSIMPKESRWCLEPSQPALRVMSIKTDCDPYHAKPTYLEVQYEGTHARLLLNTPRPTLINLETMLRGYDPDLLLTSWGDSWLIPQLMRLSKQHHIPLPFNRDKRCEIKFRRERTYFSYGQIIHRGCQAYLFGRLHIDVQNAMMFHEYEMEGIWELARITGLPTQTVARVSPGTGISAMQWQSALQQGFLIPWRKQQAEEATTALDLLAADKGGIVYQPLVGVHKEVAEIDFISMYPSIMAHYNISPETVGKRKENAIKVPELNLWVDQTQQGIVPRTIAPLLQKRIALKQCLRSQPTWSSLYRKYKAYIAAHKWLLVTCFGYLGYKNARFGKIESHQAVTAFGREVLLCAKEAAEDMGFTVLHMYVDGLWVYQPGFNTPKKMQALLDDISERVGLPISLEGIYRWVVFLPSRINARVPVPNRYFGVYDNGVIKVRGIEARRRDTPPFIVQTQMGMLTILAQSLCLEDLPLYIPQAITLLRNILMQLNHYDIPLEHLLVKQKISRNIEEYLVPSAAARAANQLSDAGKHLKAGQNVRFIYTLGDAGVYAWGLPKKPEAKWINLPYYKKLLISSGKTILQPLGVEHLIEDYNLRLDL